MRREWQRQFVELQLGWLWVFARPLLMVAIFVMLKRGANASIYLHVPYPLFLYIGLIVWFVWVEAVSSVATSGRLNSALMSKVYFPRLYSPLSQAASSGIRLVIGLAPVVALLAYFGLAPGWQIVLLPVLMVQVVLLAFAVGVIFGILSIDNNDWNNARSLVLYIGLFVSPIAYPPDMIPEGFRALHMINPMVGIVEGFRSALMGGYAFPSMAWLVSLAGTVLLAVLAVTLFNRTEARMLDAL